MKRQSKNLPSSLEHQLNRYALAASAAGVSVLALTPPTAYLLPAGMALVGLSTLPESAEAKIVYTPTRKNIVCHDTSGGGCHGSLYLNLNHGKSADFKLYCASSAGWWRGLRALPVNNNNNGVWTSGYFAAALRKGAVIQSGSHFLKDRQATMFFSSAGSATPHGPWVNVKNRYLGLTFLIKGKVHYGWARLTTPKQLWRRNHPWATLTGYAYETIPGKSIITGKTHGKDVVTVTPATLGHLARGASAIKSWRGKN